MAENQDDILEEGDGDEAQEKQTGLSTSLLIKIAIGLGVLLIALLVSFFLLSSSGETETTEDNPTSESEQVEIADADKTTDEALDLPVMPEPESADAAVEMNDVPATGQNTTTPPATPDKVLSEIIALQKQVATLQEENQALIKKVQILVQENDVLKSKVNRLANNSPDAVINDEQLVNTGDIPAYYRQNQYTNTPQIELEPKWGEFNSLDSGTSR